MPDLNPESLRRAAEALDNTEPFQIRRSLDKSVWEVWQHSDPDVVKPVVVSEHATQNDALHVAEGMTSCARAEAAIRTYLSTTPNPLRDAVGDLLHMHRQGDVSAEMWGRVQVVFDGETT